MKIIRVLPGENEDAFMELFKQFKYPNLVSCSLGEIFNKPYNEYMLSDYDYDKFKSQLNAISYIAKEKKSLKERVNDFFDRPGNMELAIGSLVLGCFAVVGGMCYSNGVEVGKQIGAKSVIDLVKKNTQPVIFKAYDAAMDALRESIKSNIPEAAEIIAKYAEENPDWTTTVGDSVVNMLDGTFYLK